MFRQPFDWMFCLGHIRIGDNSIDKSGCFLLPGCCLEVRTLSLATLTVVLLKYSESILGTAEKI